MSSPEPTPVEPVTDPGVKPPPVQPDPPTDPKPIEDLSKLRDALDKERSLRKDAERRAKDGDTHRTKLEALEAASRSDLDKAVDAARKEGAQTVLTAANRRLVLAEARALAAEARFRSPQVAVRSLDLTDVTVAEDGTVDTGAITAALTRLAADEPYMVDDGAPRTPRPDPSQGSGRTPVLTGAEKGIAEAQRRFGTKTT